MASVKNEKTKRSTWFASACSIWFSDPPLTNSNFMLLFLAPALAPCNQNYRKKAQEGGSLRTGRPKKEEQVTDATVATWQNELLKRYIKQLEALKDSEELDVDGSIPARRARVLADKLSKDEAILSENDKNFCSKPENNKEERFLKLFSNAKHLQKSATNVMKTVAGLYSQIAAIVYKDIEESRVQFVITKMEEQIREKTPTICLPAATDKNEYLGWLMCALLLLEAWENCKSTETGRLLNVLLGLDLKPEDSEVSSKPARSVKRNVLLEIPLLQNLCVMALRSEMSLEEMRSYFGMLQRIHRTAPYCICPDMLLPFIKKLEDMYGKQVMPGIGSTDQFIKLITELSQMRNACEEMLKFQQGLNG